MPRVAQFLSMQWTKKPVTLSKLRDSKMAQRHIKGKRILKSIHSPMRLSLRSRQLSIMEMKILAQLPINLSRTISIISRTSGTTSKSREILLSRSCISLLFSWSELLDWFMPSSNWRKVKSIKQLSRNRKNWERLPLKVGKISWICQDLSMRKALWSIHTKESYQPWFPANSPALLLPLPTWQPFLWLKLNSLKKVPNLHLMQIHWTLQCQLTETTKDSEPLISSIWTAKRTDRMPRTTQLTSNSSTLSMAQMLPNIENLKQYFDDVISTRWIIDWYVFDKINTRKQILNSYANYI